MEDHNTTPPSLLDAYGAARDDKALNALHRDMLKPIPADMLPGKHHTATEMRMAENAARAMSMVEDAMKPKLRLSTDPKPMHGFDFLYRTERGMYHFGDGVGKSREEMVMIYREIQRLLACQTCGGVAEEVSDGDCALCVEARRPAGWDRRDA